MLSKEVELSLGTMQGVYMRETMYCLEDKYANPLCQACSPFTPVARMQVLLSKDYRIDSLDACHCTAFSSVIGGSPKAAPQRLEFLFSLAISGCDTQRTQRQCGVSWTWGHRPHRHYPDDDPDSPHQRCSGRRQLWRSCYPPCSRKFIKLSP